MSSNFAFIPSTLTETTDVNTTVELPIFKELAFDFETGQLKTKGGQYYYVEKNEAIKIWCWKALFSQRYLNLAYSVNYGNDTIKNMKFENNKLLLSELRRMIEEALLCNPYILNLSDFDITQEGSKVTCNYSVNTIYGNVAQAYTYEV